MTPLESKLRRLAASLDEAAFEALASKGLLRRAQKDLERGIEAGIAGESGTVLRLVVGEFEVTLPESGPATATCSCPAAGVCQHILTAMLFLQQEPSGSVQESLPGVSAAEVPVSPEQELMATTPEQLERWAGKAAFRAGLRLASQFTPEIVRDRAIRIRFPAMNSQVHFVPGGGLDGMIVSGGKGDGRQLVVAAVIGFQRVGGKEWTIPVDSAGLEASEGAPPQSFRGSRLMPDPARGNAQQRTLPDFDGQSTALGHSGRFRCWRESASPRPVVARDWRRSGSSSCA